MSPQLYLASRSPRRRELLEQAAIAFELIDVEVDESGLPNEHPADYVQRLAQAKAGAGFAAVKTGADALSVPVLGADTCVVVDGKTLGKPADYDDAVRMLTLLSGSTHDVYTGMALDDGAGSIHAVSRSVVHFRYLNSDQIRAYWDSGEPCDKAGAYAIQGYGARFVTRLEGSYSGVVGLCLSELDRMLHEYQMRQQ